VGIVVARLLLESGGERREINVAGPIVVGRSQTAGVYLDDKTLSREHTKFYIENGKLFVRDLESKNGTYLNGALIKNTQPLKHGDRVKVGVATFTVLADDAARPAVTAPLASAPAPRPSAPAGATATAPAAPARPRTARTVLGGPSSFTVFLYRIILVAVIVVVAVMSKGFFQMLLRGK
jgi:predicted component of type VI protein secretion system